MTVHMVCVRNQIFVSPQNSYVGALPLSVMVLGGGTFRRQLDLDEIMHVEPP